METEQRDFSALFSTITAPIDHDDLNHGAALITAINAKLNQATPVATELNYTPKGQLDGYKVVIKGKEQFFDRSEFRTALRELQSHRATQLNALPSEIKSKLESVIESVRHLQETDQYNSILQDIKEIFNGKEAVIPGTIGAVFTGCFVSTLGSDIGCDPRCAASLNGLSNHGKCKDSVLLHTNGELSYLHNASSSHAFIHLGDPKFTGFTRENVAMLKKDGINSLTMVYGDGKGNYLKVEKAVPAEKWPIVGATDSASYANVWWGLLILIVLILLIGGALYFFFFRSPVSPL